MLKTAREYLNCHYEPLKNESYNCDQCKKKIKPIADLHIEKKENIQINNEKKLINIKYCCCSTTTYNNKLNSNKNLPTITKNNNNNLCFQLLKKMGNYYKTPNLIWYLIIPPALVLTFVIFLMMFYKNYFKIVSFK